MTTQETFDTVVAHLRQQGRQALSAAGLQCRYRDPNGLKCAAGCLIPDDRYCKQFEGFGVMSSRDGRLAALLQELGHDLALVAALQTVHDSYSPASWEREFAHTALNFDLIYTPKETV